MKEKLVMIGNGMAGMRTIEELLKNNPKRQMMILMTVVVEEEEGKLYFTVII